VLFVKVLAQGVVVFVLFTRVPGALEFLDLILLPTDYILADIPLFIELKGWANFQVVRMVLSPLERL
jgi:hypothetical protein